jgi:hypothetical protein
MFWSKYRRYFLVGVWLVWPILLGIGAVVAAPLHASVRGPGQSPRLEVISLGNPVGPPLTEAKAMLAMLLSHFRIAISGDYHHALGLGSSSSCLGAHRPQFASDQGPHRSVARHGAGWPGYCY